MPSLQIDEEGNDSDVLQTPKIGKSKKLPKFALPKFNGDVTQVTL